MATSIDDGAVGAARDAAEDLDREALRRVADGDAEAFSVLVERHQERLLRVCRRMLTDSEEARDAAQEVLLKAYRNAASYNPRGKVYTWLYRIAVNHCLNRLRRRKVVRFLPWGSVGGGGAPEDDGPPFDPPAEAPGPEEELAARRRWQRVRRAVADLPDGQRAVLVLVRFEGLSYKETGEVLGISLGAVESRLFRAMRTLEQVVAPEASS